MVGQPKWIPDIHLDEEITDEDAEAVASLHMSNCELDMTDVTLFEEAPVVSALNIELNIPHMEQNC